MFLKFFLFFILVFNYSLNLYANEKRLIIDKLLNINNFTFNFEQITQGKIETGSCLLVFDNKLKCNYIDNNQKEIIINNKKLVVMQKRYNKIYFYPISKSPFLKILNKNSLINLIRKSNLELNNNIKNGSRRRKHLTFHAFNSDSKCFDTGKTKTGLQNRILHIDHSYCLGIQCPASIIL